MSVGQHTPLGDRIPESIHAVSVSIPTMADVIGYEEKDPDTFSKICSGYPRFVVHSYLKKIEEHWQRLFDCPDHFIWLTSSKEMAKRLQTFLGASESKHLRHRGVSGLRIHKSSDPNGEAKGYLQHVGGFLSTRQAEDYLFAEGLIQSLEAEKSYLGDAKEKVLDRLHPFYETKREDIIFSNTGMNAFFATFCAINEIQSPKNRCTWLKLGWLYTDTMHILDKLGSASGINEEVLDVFNLNALEEILEKRGSEIAAIVTEAPTNPLIQSMDLERIRSLVSKYDIYLVIDPTVASISNVNVTPFSDVIVNSLTKYTASEGDLMMGAVALTETCPDKEKLKTLIEENIESPYYRDLARLAYQIGDYVSVSIAINENTAKVVAFLSEHPKIKKVYWAKEERSKANFEKIARSSESIGCLLSFEYDGPLDEFYDRVKIPKGPSFGMKTTLLCPYIFLAHYSLTKSEEGRTKLAQAGINPELIRLSIGTEPAEEIIAALSSALASS